jgi:hypothetical protein
MLASASQARGEEGCEDRTRLVNKNPLWMLNGVDRTLEVRRQVVSFRESGHNLTARVIIFAVEIGRLWFKRGTHGSHWVTGLTPPDAGQRSVSPRTEQ